MLEVVVVPPVRRGAPRSSPHYTTDADGADIDVSSLALQGVPPLAIGGGPKTADLGAPDDADCQCNQSTGSDPYRDLLLKFPARDVLAALPGTGATREQSLTLTGRLHSGLAFELQDCIVLVGGKDRNGPSLVDSPIDAGMLRGVHPNPFNPTTTLTYSLAHDSRIETISYWQEGRFPSPLSP